MAPLTKIALERAPYLFISEWTKSRPVELKIEARSLRDAETTALVLTTSFI